MFLPATSISRLVAFFCIKIVLVTLHYSIVRSIFTEESVPRRKTMRIDSVEERSARRTSVVLITDLFDCGGLFYVVFNGLGEFICCLEAFNGFSAGNAICKININAKCSGLRKVQVYN